MLKSHKIMLKLIDCVCLIYILKIENTVNKLILFSHTNRTLYSKKQGLMERRKYKKLRESLKKTVHYKFQWP